ncbi:hypothetical protein ADM98_11640 [Exiguobacterium sp. BMC-KP]|uniref:hypothetical protein n=1 Tax=Exiguobacterium sp. BMC-KP TaxID=1684312 RepID=UPI0006AA0B55|nr:hypothetical protein [Exiguobacterium sp. BMC-KP]KOP29513.1 hypothetical protein ADM98_11640 [Exiguobacterium sp. BMC-KP]
MVTTHKIGRALPAIVQTTPEILNLVAKGPVKIDAIHAALTASYQHLANAAYQLDANHPVHAFLKQVHNELYTIENALDEQNNLFLTAEDSIDAKVVAL